MKYPLMVVECLKVGGHCFENSAVVTATYPPIHHRICKHCGLVEEGREQPEISWVRDSSQPNLRKEGK